MTTHKKHLHLTESSLLRGVCPTFFRGSRPRSLSRHSKNGEFRRKKRGSPDTCQSSSSPPPFARFTPSGKEKLCSFEAKRACRAPSVHGVLSKLVFFAKSGQHSVKKSKKSRPSHQRREGRLRNIGQTVVITNRWKCASNHP